MKWLLILLLIGCSTTIIKEREVKDEIYDVYNRTDGYCNYILQPRTNYIIKYKEECDKYKVGDSLTRIEQYTVEKE